MSEPSPIRVGVSACLLGDNVRYDGGHKHDRYVTGVLGEHFTLVRVCPEEEAGFGTPRDAMRLVGDPEAPRLVTIRGKADLTRAMRQYSQGRVRALEGESLDGYILKAKSPSCGLYRVKVYRPEGGTPSTAGRGLFAEALTARFPHLPIEEEGRLHDAHLRESFIVRVFCHARFRQDVLAGRFHVRKLVAFHAAHKLLLMSRSETHMRELGRLVASAKGKPRGALLDEYAAGFFEGMAKRATRRRHTNVLEHMAGHFKKRLDDWDRRNLREVIADYHGGLVPLVVPLTLIRHHAEKHDVETLTSQVYLRPHPKELMLLNHV